MNQKHTGNFKFFQTINTEEKAYWLGFLAADGNLHSRENGNRTINLCCAEKDYGHLLLFKNTLESSHNIYINEGKSEWSNGNKICRYSISSIEMFNDLVDKGLTERKSLTLEPPKNVPEDLIHHWIRGYFDGDGSVHIYYDKREKQKKNPNKLRGSFAGTHSVLSFIKEKVSITGNVRQPKEKSIFYLRFSGKFQTEKVYKYLYSDAKLFLLRKKVIFEEGIF